MQFMKISCAHCSQQAQCSQKTRMFVNYCGSNRRKVQDQIRDAQNECINRKGHSFKRVQGFLSTPEPKTLVLNAAS
ncbi:MAG: hypothetical protein LBI42_10645 [Chitinispirillales bacterium]|jgi:hypothetical protein|nr:hypothetical protein [Chitinispirillales bacterium]